jgi:hypothetical protein
VTVDATAKQNLRKTSGKIFEWIEIDIGNFGLWISDISGTN